jgi:hypothetical protein
MKNQGLPPATAYHRVSMRALNGVLRLLWKTGIGKTDLSAQSLITAARKATGLSDFGDPPIDENLRRLLQATEAEADLNPIGRMLTRQSYLRVLKHRLWAQALFSQHPEIDARTLADPIVVVGLARSGTTRLHRLLASDTQFNSLKTWESLNPVPWPGCFDANGNAVVPDPRIRNTEDGLKFVIWMGPQIEAVHPLGAHEVEEEVGLIEHALSSQLFEVIRRLPSFGDWLMRNDQTYAYNYMARLLKMIEWFRKEPPQKTWVLKTPQHMQDLDALLNVFPNAKLLFIHRDPVAAVGSACSMTWNALVRDTDSITPQWVGEEWLNKTDAMLRKIIRLRESIPASQQLDIYYDDMNRDWQGVIRKIYDFTGFELKQSALDAMAAWLQGNKQHKHGKHTYRLEDFGLTEAAVAGRLAYYRDKYRIPPERQKS